MRYKYLTRLEVTESTDPQFKVGKEFIMLGKQRTREIVCWNKEMKKLVWAKVKSIETYDLPNLMNKQDAWAYFEEHYEEKILA